MDSMMTGDVSPSTFSTGAAASPVQIRGVGKLPGAFFDCGVSASATAMAPAPTTPASKTSTADRSHVDKPRKETIRSSVLIVLIVVPRRAGRSSGTRGAHVSTPVIYYDIYQGRSKRCPAPQSYFGMDGSQAVRLPADFRFEGTEVYVRQDPATGDVTLSRRPDSWEGFFKLAGAGGCARRFHGRSWGRGTPETRSVPMTSRYLLDTNIATYVIKGNIPAVRRRIVQVPVAQLAISAVTEGELRHGVARAARRRPFADRRR